jgi:LacI family transcriptional regulator
MATATTSNSRRRRRILLALELSGENVDRRVGIAEYAREAGWILESRLMAFLAIGRHKEYLASIPIDGIISRMLNSRPELHELVASAKVPVVDLWKSWPELNVPRVLLDYKAGARLAADHLLDLGFKQLLFYSHTVDRGAADLRCDGCREAADARGAKVNEVWWDSHVPTPEALGRIGWLADELKKFVPPIGVVASNDFAALDVLDAADHVGFNVPEDVAVIGSDNDPILTELAAVPLTSVDIARPRLGYEAAALLDRMIDGQEPPASPILIAPAGVVVRRSTEVIAIADADVSAAARFIRDHFREPITVEDVIAKSFLSRRRLQDRFLAALGHGMNEEITRQRVQFAKHLLMQTKHKVSAIAKMAGFGSVHRMSKVFKREVETSPQAYRQKYHPAFSTVASSKAENGNGTA